MLILGTLKVFGAKKGCSPLTNQGNLAHVVNESPLPPLLTTKELVEKIKGVV
ncbi:hypothetical protein L0F63_000841 [Massospora cicadina]|nr:hypothetical protein L0F63_000841 [Massospora cicadina]